MAHSHSHDSQTTFYVEQIFTIAACGAIAGVCVLLYVRDGLYGMLKPDQHLRVLFGGVGLLMLVVIRAAYVWIAAGKTPVKAAAHNHNHGHNHDHDHAHCDHDHGHEHQHEHAIKVDDHDHVPAAFAQPEGHELFHDHQGHDHDHGWAPWRYALLLLPVVLFLLGLPAAGGMNTSNVSAVGDLNGVGDAAGKGENFTIGFNQLEQAARNPEVRENIAGTTVRLTGQYKSDRPDRFTLVRFKINCCAADAIPLKAVIMIDPAKADKYTVNPDKYRNKWVQVTGKLQFSTIAGSREVIPVILLSPDSKEQLENDLVKEVPPDTNPYAN
jgi:hypothetical protein